MRYICRFGSTVRKLTWLRCVVLVFVISACGSEAPSPGDVREDTTIAGAATASRGASVPIESLIDPNLAPAVATEDGWNYHLSIEVDLDGDGETERVVLTARVEMPKGRPAWDDGQPWQVYVESDDGVRTYVYAQRLQLGTLAMRVTRGDEARPTIVLIEHVPDRLRIIEASYAGPSQASAAIAFERMLDPRGDMASPNLP